MSLRPARVPLWNHVLKINQSTHSSINPREESASQMLSLDYGFNSAHALRTLSSVAVVFTRVQCGPVFFMHKH